MQVSWIDPDEIRALLKQVEGPKQASTGSAWEVHTLPTAHVAPLEAEPLLGDEASPTTPVSLVVDPPMANERPSGPANAELWRIRERLRALRDKAHSAGIFSRSRPAEATPEPAPVVAEQETAIPTEPEPPVPEPEPVAEISFEPAVAETEPMPIAEPPPVAEEAVPIPPPEPIQSPFELAEPAATLYEPLFGASPDPAPVGDSAPPAVAPVPAEPEAVAFTVPNQGLSERLNAVAEWVCCRLGTREVLLVDDYGDVLWGAQGQTALVLSAVMAWHSAQRSSASATCIDPDRIDKPLPPDRALTVLPLRTRYGVVSLAVIQSQPVGIEDAALIRHALSLAVEGQGPSNDNDGA